MSRTTAPCPTRGAALRTQRSWSWAAIEVHLHPADKIAPAHRDAERPCGHVGRTDTRERGHRIEQHHGSGARWGGVGGACRLDRHRIRSRQNGGGRAELIVPVAGAPPVTPFTDHVTAVLAVPVRLAVNCCVSPERKLAVPGEIETLTPGGGPGRPGPPPPQPVRRQATSGKSKIDRYRAAFPPAWVPARLSASAAEESSLRRELFGNRSSRAPLRRVMAIRN